MPTTAQSDSKSGKVLPADSLVGQNVYALGALSFDFGSIQRRDVMFAANGGRPIITNADLSAFLSNSPVSTADFESIIWTLTLDGAPMYALRTAVNHGLNEWGMMQVVLAALADPTVDRLAVPGTITGDVTLLDGRVVPVIDPDVRGILTWSSTAVSLAVGLTGVMALPPLTVNLTTDQAPTPPVDWSSWNLLPTLVHKATGGSLIGLLTPIGTGGTGLLTPYTGSTIGITWNAGDGSQAPPPPPPAVPGYAFSGAAVSAVGGGFQLTAPADTTPRTLRLYTRTFSSTGQISVSLSDGSAPAYVDTSFNAFPSIAGLPGVVDGFYTITYVAQTASSTLLVQFTGTSATAVSANPLSVTLFSGTNGTGTEQQVTVGSYPGATITAGVANVGSAYIPPGLRLTVFNKDILGPTAPVPPITGTAFPATAAGATFTTFPAGVQNTTHSLIVEAENYVGIQAASLQLAPTAGSPLIGPSPLQDFMDRVYYLLRNAGITSQERAINFAATQAAPLPGFPTQVSPNQVLANALAAGLSLEAISAEPWLACRPGSDCWDVKFTFFEPRQRVQAARTFVRLTVDVSNVRPVTVTPARIWTAY
jgi:PatG C-terminal